MGKFIEINRKQNIANNEEKIFYINDYFRRTNIKASTEH
jgi:hypothetical protein